MKNRDNGNKSYLLGITLVAALGGLLFGYDTAVISGVIENLKIKFDLSSKGEGAAVAIALVGCVFGVFAAGNVSDKIGRKKTLILTALLFLISSIIAAIASNLGTFMIGRFIGGLGIGAASVVSPLYISEIAPEKIRGTLVTLYQLAIVLGINLIYFVNLKIAGYGDEAWNVNTGWRYMIASGVIPSVLFLLLLALVPETPRWLTGINKNEEALKILQKINGTEKASEIQEEIKESIQQATKQERGRLQDLFKPGLRMAMIVGLMLAFFAQVTGINAIIYYAPKIFIAAGFGTESALFQTVLIGIINTIFTFVAIWLIDTAGRKKLLIWGITGMLISLLAIGACYHFNYINGPFLLIFILGFIACFACSMGPIPWVIISEIYPSKVRGMAMGIASAAVWIGALLISFLFPWLLENLGGAYTFWLFAFNAIILLAFTITKVPETRQKTLEEIEKSWQRK